MTCVVNGRRQCGHWRRLTDRTEFRRAVLVSVLPVLLTTLSCGGDAGTPTPPTGPAPAPPSVPRPPEPTRAELTVDPTSVREDAGATTLTVTATLVGEGTRTTPTAIALSVDEGTATAADYAATQATVTIAAGRTSAMARLTVTPVSDALLEGPETVIVTGTAQGITVQSAVVTINDPPAPTEAVLTVDPPTVREDAGTTAISVTVTLKGEGPWVTASHIALAIRDGTATGGDYVATQATLTIGAQESSGTAVLTLTPVSDTLLEGSETVVVTGMADGVTVQSAEVTINDPPVSVFFATDRLEIPEGESGELVVHYWVADLATSLDLGISFLPGSASEADFVAPVENIHIPAGRLMSGQVQIPIATTADRTVTEGAETLTVRFIPPRGIEASLVVLGQDLEVVISDRGLPCPGVVVRGDAPQRRHSARRATLVVEWLTSSDGSFDWERPYYDDEDDPENRYRTPLLEVNIAEWRVETIEGATRHTLEIEWPPFLETWLVFRSNAGACELPVLACGATRCVLRE